MPNLNDRDAAIVAHFGHAHGSTQVEISAATGLHVREVSRVLAQPVPIAPGAPQDALDVMAEWVLRISDIDALSGLTAAWGPLLEAEAYLQHQGYPVGSRVRLSYLTAVAEARRQDISAEVPVSPQELRKIYAP